MNSAKCPIIRTGHVARVVLQTIQRYLSKIRGLIDTSPKCVDPIETSAKFRPHFGKLGEVDPDMALEAPVNTLSNNGRHESVQLWLGAIGVFFLDTGAPLAYILVMTEGLFTVAETSLFSRQAKVVWSEEEHDEFVLYIAGNPEAGDVIADTGGVRKVRWKRAGSGKRGGVRVIYFYHDRERPL